VLERGHESEAYALAQRAELRGIDVRGKHARQTFVAIR